MWQASSGGIWRWTMSPELDSVATAFVGSAALTSMFVVLAMIGTLNHYHRPIIPVLGALLVMLSCTYLLAWADGTAVDTLALRMTLSEGVFAMLDLFPFVFLILTALLLEASLRKRPEDPLLALLESESGSE